MTYFAFAIADSMFHGSATVVRRPLTAEEVREALGAGGVAFAVNPAHAATVDALIERYGICVEIPATPPVVTLGVGDSLIVASVRGLPRLTDRHEYTREEIDAATFSFGKWTVTA